MYTWLSNLLGLPTTPDIFIELASMVLLIAITLIILNLFMGIFSSGFRRR